MEVLRHHFCTRGTRAWSKEVTTPFSVNCHIGSGTVRYRRAHADTSGSRRRLSSYFGCLDTVIAKEYPTYGLVVVVLRSRFVPTPRQVDCTGPWCLGYVCIWSNS